MHISTWLFVMLFTKNIYIYMYMSPFLSVIFFLYLCILHLQELDVSYVPCSGLTGENLVKPSTVPELTSWYGGPTLLATIGKLCMYMYMYVYTYMYICWKLLSMYSRRQNKRSVSIPFRFIVRSIPFRSVPFLFPFFPFF